MEKCFKRKELMLKLLILIILFPLNVLAEIVPLEDWKETPFLLAVNRGCSGTILSPYIGVTAAHCILQKDLKTLKSDPPTLSINPSFNIGQHWLNASVELFKIRTFGYKHVAQFNEDWAIIVFERPIILFNYPKIFPYEEMKSLRGTTISSYGYPRILKGERAKTINSKFLDAKTGYLQIQQNVDGLKGLSGGPAIIQDGEYKGYFVGVNSAFGISRNKYRISYSQKLYDVLKEVTEADMNRASKEDLTKILKGHNH